MFPARIETGTFQTSQIEKTSKGTLPDGHGYCVRSTEFPGKAGIVDAVLDYTHKKMLDFVTVWVMIVATFTYGRPGRSVAALLLVETESCHGCCFKRVGCCNWWSDESAWPRLREIEQRDFILI
jgi:hypothetical protein